MSMVERVAAEISLVIAPHGVNLPADVWREAARAAIEAMREPTEDMMRAIPHIDCWEQSHVYDHQIREGWRAMIDAALKD